MRIPTPSISISAALLVVGLLGATPASAEVQGGDTFRVTGIASSQAVNLMNGPARWSGIEVQIPYNAHAIRATGVRQANWLQVSYRASNGYDYTGWVESQFLAPDQQLESVFYRIVNVARGASVPLLDRDGNGDVRAYIPANAGVLPASGPCQNGFCQVRYRSNRGTIEGLVDQDYLTPVQSAYSQLPDPAPDYTGYARADAAYADGLPADQYSGTQDGIAPVDGYMPLPPRQGELYDHEREPHHAHPRIHHKRDRD